MKKLIDECGMPKACWKCQPEPCDQCDTINEVFERLKKYEDTDRMPEEIPALISEVEQLTKENKKLKKSLFDPTEIEQRFQKYVIEEAQKRGKP